MPPVERPSAQAAPTPVDLVRTVREKLSREAGNDVHKLAEKAYEIARRFDDKLGLKRMAPDEPGLQ
jgi:hypothetical protein